MLSSVDEPHLQGAVRAVGFSHWRMSVGGAPPAAGLQMGFVVNLLISWQKRAERCRDPLAVVVPAVAGVVEGRGQPVRS